MVNPLYPVAIVKTVIFTNVMENPMEIIALVKVFYKLLR